jgi:hypothetical protein
MDNTKEVEKIIQDFFSLRYYYLLECSKNILKLVKRQDLCYILIEDAYIYVNENIDKLTPLIHKGKLESIVIRFMNMQIRWKNTKFKKDNLHSNKFLTDKPLEDVEMYTEIEDEVVSEEELLQNEVDIENKLNHISTKLGELDLSQRILFDSVFNLGHSTSGKLSQWTKLSRTGCYYLIKNLNDTLRNDFKN